MDEQIGAFVTGLVNPADAVSYAISEGIRFIVSDKVLSRARSCKGRGFEVWHALHKESTPGIAAKATRFQDPVRCTSVLQLLGALPRWEQLGAVTVSGGYPVLG